MIRTKHYYMIREDTSAWGGYKTYLQACAFALKEKIHNPSRKIQIEEVIEKSRIVKEL